MELPDDNEQNNFDGCLFLLVQIGIPLAFIITIIYQFFKN